MNTLEIRGDLEILKGRVQNWSALTQDDFLYVKGKHEEWLGRIEKRTGATREAIEKAIKGVFSSRS